MRSLNLNPRPSSRKRSTGRGFLDRPVARLEHLGGLHSAEELEDVPARALDAQCAVDAGLAVVDVAEHAPARRDHPAPGVLERLGVGHLEPDVVVAAVHGVLDQDQLVVTLVAREVRGAGAPLGLDHADDLALELDRGVEIPDAQSHMTHSSDHLLRLPFWL